MLKDKSFWSVLLLPLKPHNHEGKKKNRKKVPVVSKQLSYWFLCWPPRTVSWTRHLWTPSATAIFQWSFSILSTILYNPLMHFAKFILQYGAFHCYIDCSLFRLNCWFLFPVHVCPAHILLFTCIWILSCTLPRKIFSVLIHMVHFSKTILQSIPLRKASLSSIPISPSDYIHLSHLYMR